MRTTMDSGGRVVIPKPIRSALGLRPGDQLEVSETDGSIRINAIREKVTLEQGKGGLVAVADTPVEPLTVEAVRDLVERLRR